MAVSGPAALRITLDGVAHDVSSEPADATLEHAGPGVALLRLSKDARRVLWQALPAGSTDGAGRVGLEIVVDGWRFAAAFEPLARARLREKARRGPAERGVHQPLIVRAPIPGRIGSVRVADGQAVEAGDPLVTLEAMKMENIVRAPRAGTIARVVVAAGTTVELGDALVELA